MSELLESELSFALLPFSLPLDNFILFWEGFTSFSAYFFLFWTTGYWKNLLVPFSIDLPPFLLFGWHLCSLRRTLVFFVALFANVAMFLRWCWGILRRWKDDSVESGCFSPAKKCLYHFLLFSRESSGGVGLGTEREAYWMLFRMSIASPGLLSTGLGSYLTDIFIISLETWSPSDLPAPCGTVVVRC